MAKQTINLGTMADNKSGDPLRTAFTKINENFDELYNQTGGGVGVNVGDQTTEPSQITDIIFNGATVENVEGVSTVTITPTTIPPIPSLGVVTVDGTAIIGGRVGAAGLSIFIETDYEGNQPAINGNGVYIALNPEQFAALSGNGTILALNDGYITETYAPYPLEGVEGVYVVGWTDSHNSNGVPIYPLTIQSPNYSAGEPSHLVLSSGTTAPGAAIDVKEEEVTVNFSGSGVVYRLTPSSITLPSGMTIAHQAEQTIETGSGITIQAADLSGATIGWGAPTINADNIVTNGWDYVSFVNQTWYDYLYNLLGGQNGGVNVTWAGGSTEIQSGIYVQFTDVNTFQVVPSSDAGGSPLAGTWYFPVSIGASTVTIPAAMEQTVNNITWKYRENGDTVLPGALIESVAQVPENTRIIDITKSVVVLNDGQNWELPDGEDGQRISFVPDNASYKQNIWVAGNIAGWHYNDAQQNMTTAGIGNGWWINPFMNWNEDLTNSQFQARTLVDAVFVNGAWHFQGGVFD